jgi:putative membrane protein
MRNFIVILNLAIVLLIASFISDPERQRLEAVADERQATSVKAASIVPINDPAHSSVASGRMSRSERRAALEMKRKREFVADFIHEASQARIMDREQGKLAAQRGTSRLLKDYGSLIVTDQTRMLNDLKQIASRKEFKLATVLDKRKTEGLSELHQLHGEKFDEKFIKMMITDHKRDIKKLEKATRSKDADIQVFATKYLPVVKGHLAKLQAIADKK